MLFAACVRAVSRTTVALALATGGAVAATETVLEVGGGEERPLRWAAEDGVNGGFPGVFQIGTSVGTLVGSVAASPEIPEWRARLWIEPDPGDRRSADDAEVAMTFRGDPSGGETVGLILEFSEIGAFYYRITAQGVDLIAHTVDRCSALATSDLYRAITEAATLLQDRAVAGGDDPAGTEAFLSMLLQYAALGPTLVEDCASRSSMAGLIACSHSRTREGCVACCDSQFVFMGSHLVSECRLLARAVCLDAEDRMECEKAATAICVGVGILRVLSCYSQCSSKPSDEDLGRACGANAVCRFECPPGELPIHGNCPAGMVCCR